MLNNISSRIRRNHGLEHATIHVLSQKHQAFGAQGNSTHQGFYLNIYGEIPTAEIESAVHEALRRLKGGEHGLAVHPNCGTVLLTTATTVALASNSMFAIEQIRQRRRNPFAPSVILNGLPSAVLAGVVALIVSRPLGLYLQEKYTTSGEMGKLEVKTVRQIPPSAITRLFRLLLGQGSQIKSSAYQIITTG